MLKITFHPDYDNNKLAKAATKYQNIWDNEGERIIKAFNKIAKLDFKEKFINAVIFKKGIPHSHPLSLTADKSYIDKTTILIHELTHRLIVGNSVKINFSNKDSHDAKTKDVHKVVNLILYDVWVDLFDKQVANDRVDFEKNLSTPYKEAWDWALSFTKDERAKKFKNLVKNKVNHLEKTS